jgi:threonine dehydrogenase-like Zn-dependent dehydrogenase
VHTLRAVAVHPGASSIEVVEVAEPARPGGDGVLARMLEVGICGSDREIAATLVDTPRVRIPGARTRR